MQSRSIASNPSTSPCTRRPTKVNLKAALLSHNSCSRCRRTIYRRAARCTSSRKRTVMACSRFDSTGWRIWGIGRTRTLSPRNRSRWTRQASSMATPKWSPKRPCCSSSASHRAHTTTTRSIKWRTTCVQHFTNSRSIRSSGFSNSWVRTTSTKRSQAWSQILVSNRHFKMRGCPI